jgi:murein L,D-transpeptidase YafK
MTRKLPLSSRIALGLLLAVGALGVAVARADDGFRIVVWKARRQLWLVRDDIVVRRYPVSLGSSPLGAKEALGDKKTPVGTYYVYEKRDQTKYHRFLGLSYPSIDDAERAFRAGVIDANTWADIFVAAKLHQKPPWNTPLGGFVGIHGTGADGQRALLRQLYDWTDGCIALSDRDVEELYRVVPVGTPVEIRE